MQDIIERVKQLTAEQRSWEVREYVPTILDTLTGDDKAKVLQHLAKAYELTATTGAEYRKALSIAEEAVAVAEPGGLMQTWALHFVAAYAADIGKWAQAERAAVEFSQRYQWHSATSSLAPFVSAALGRVRVHQGRYEEALILFEAAYANAHGELADRVWMLYVWALIKAQRFDEAYAALPKTVSTGYRWWLYAALAEIAYAQGDNEAAYRYGRNAIREQKHGSYRIYDILSIANILLILKQVSLETKNFKEAYIWHIHRKALLLGWNVGETLQTDFPTEGGCVFEAASGFGPAGAERMGLLGTVG